MNPGGLLTVALRVALLWTEGGDLQHQREAEHSEAVGTGYLGEIYDPEQVFLLCRALQDPLAFQGHVLVLLLILR